MATAKLVLPATMFNEITDMFKPADIALALTQEEADYLAKLTEIYRIEPQHFNCSCEACVLSCIQDHPEPIPESIIRRRIFDSLSGVTQSS